MAQQGASKADLDADAEKDKKKKKQAEKADSETADSEDDSKKKKKNEEDEDEDEDEEEGSKAKKKKKEKKKRDFNLSPESEALQNEIYALLSKETKDHKLAVVQFYINRIFKIDDVDQATHLDFYLKVNWIDRNWVGKTDDEFQADDDKFNDSSWWTPGVEVTNAISLNKETPEEEAYWIEFPKYGILAYTQRYIGTIYSYMDLHVIPITFESFHWKASDLTLLRLPRHAVQRKVKGSPQDWISMSPDVKLLDWHVKEITVTERVKHYAFEDRSYSQIYVEIKVSRRYEYYLSRMMSVVALAVMMTWCTSVVPFEEVQDRFAITVTLFLAAVAFNFVVSSSLPKVPYNTKFDVYLLVCYMLITANIVSTAVLFYIWKEDRDLSALVDKLTVAGYALIFFSYNFFFCFHIIKRRLRGKRPPATVTTTAFGSGALGFQNPRYPIRGEAAL